MRDGGEHVQTDTGTTVGPSYPTARSAPRRRRSGGLRDALPMWACGFTALTLALLAATGSPERHFAAPPLSVDLERVVGYVGLTLYAGTCIFWWRVSPPRAPLPTSARARLSHLAWSGLAVLAFSSAAGLAWAMAYGHADSRLVLSLGARLLICALAAPLLGRALSDRAALAGAGLSSLALAQTVVTARPEPLSWLTVAVTTVHVLAACGWLGGLVALAVALIPLPDSRALHAAVVRFPQLSLSCVALLATSGLFHAWSVAGSWSRLLHSSYGVLLVDKSLLVAGMLAAGAGSHHYVKSLAGRARTVQVLGLFVGAELAFGAGALVVTLRLTRAAFAF